MGAQRTVEVHSIRVGQAALAETGQLESKNVTLQNRQPRRFARGPHLFFSRGTAAVRNLGTSEKDVGVDDQIRFRDDDVYVNVTFVGMKNSRRNCGRKLWEKTVGEHSKRTQQENTAGKVVL